MNGWMLALNVIMWWAAGLFLLALAWVLAFSDWVARRQLRRQLRRVPLSPDAPDLERIP